MKNILGTDGVSAEQSSERDAGHFYACKELAKMALPDYPGTERGWLKLVEREQWPWREAHSRGGKAGIKRLYQPPPEIQSLIDAAGTGKALAATIREAGDQYRGTFINVVLLAQLLNAVDTVAARKFDKPLPTTVRLAAALDAYQSMKEHGLPDPLDPVACSRLGPSEFEAAASLALWSADAEKYAGGDDLAMSMVSIGDGRMIRLGR